MITRYSFAKTFLLWYVGFVSLRNWNYGIRGLNTGSRLKAKGARRIQYLSLSLDKGDRTHYDWYLILETWRYLDIFRGYRVSSFKFPVSLSNSGPCCTIIKPLNCYKSLHFQKLNPAHEGQGWIEQIINTLLQHPLSTATTGRLSLMPGR